ncbi:MAG: hypothetical protein K2X00_16860 [Nitrospiraceae bacterium]|nr:hypothetical protein [Nitrospiraceae bacterium]
MEANLHNKPPSCLKGFSLVVKLETDNSHVSAFSLSCNCGSAYGVVLGYPLKDYKSGSSNDTFIGPLAFFCPSCGKTTEIVDTDVHGYHGSLKFYAGETTSPSTVRGHGGKTEYQCVTCGCRQMRVSVAFRYSGAEQDVEEDYNTGHIEEFFLGMAVHGACMACGHKAVVADFVHL